MAVDIITSKEFLGTAGSLLVFLAVAITFAVRHFRRLRLVKSLLERVPVALYDGMILDATSANHSAFAALRSTKRFVCRETLRA